MSMEERLVSHYDSLSRAVWFTRSADNKAAPVLALQVALAGTLAARMEGLWAIISANPSGIEAVALSVLLGLYVLFLITAIAMAANVYIPRNPGTGKSLIYFEDIGAKFLKCFEVQARQLDAQAIEGQLLEQIHAVSRIASIKMRRVRLAFYFSGPAVLLWVVLLAWGSI